MLRTLTLSAALLVLCGVSGLPAQQPTFRSTTDLVIIDAVVVDAAGNAVRGLKASDFALTDRKKPQPVATFEEVSHERPASAADAPRLPATLPRDVASNTAVQADRLVMLFIDDLHIWRGRTDAAKALARDIVTKLGDQASMAVIFSSHEGSTQVTQDRSSLLTAIDGMQARQSVRRPHQGFLPQGIAAVNPEAPIEFKLEAVNKAGRASLQDSQENMQHLETLKGAAKMLLQEDRRRKAFVVVSEGMDVDMSSLMAAESTLGDMVGETPELRLPGGANLVVDLMNALRRANVAVYAIDPRGKVRAEDMMLESWPPPTCAVCENAPALPEPAQRVPTREDSQFAWQNPVRVAQASLGFLSEAAGGFAVTDTNALTGGLGRILEDLDHYYLLGFYPQDTKGKAVTHPIGLTVPAHPEYTVRFRRGYIPDAPSARTSSKDPLAELVTGVMPRGDLPLRLTAMALPGDAQTVTVQVTLEVTAPVARLTDADRKLRDDVSYSVMAVNGKTAKVTQRISRSASFTMRAPAAGAPVPDNVSYQIPVTLDLEPGRYQLRASAMSRKLDTGGSVYFDVTVPDFSKAPLALTTMALGFADGARVPIGRTPPVAGETDRNPLPFEPTLSREFARTDTLRAYLVVARTDMRTTVALEMRVFDANNEPQWTYDTTVGPGHSGAVDFRIPLEALGAGAFTIQVVARESGHVAKAQTGLIIR